METVNFPYEICTEWHKIAPRFSNLTVYDYIVLVLKANDGYILYNCLVLKL